MLGHYKFGANRNQFGCCICWVSLALKSDDHVPSMQTNQFSGKRHMQFFVKLPYTPHMQYFCLFLFQLQLFLLWCCIVLSFWGLYLAWWDADTPMLRVSFVWYRFHSVLLAIACIVEGDCQVQSITFPLTNVATVYLLGNWRAGSVIVSRASLKGGDLGVSFKTSRWD